MTPTTLVTLGTCCAVTFDIYKFGMSAESNLFDWYLSAYFKDIITILKAVVANEKIEFTERDGYEGNLFLNNTCIRTSHYTRETITDIFARRAQRLIDLIKSDTPILFIRDETSIIYNNDVEEFKTIIESVNPSCIYTLLIMSKYDVYRSPIRLAKVNHVIKPETGSWFGFIESSCPGDLPGITNAKPNDND